MTQTEFVTMRRRMNLSQTQLGAILGVTQQAVNKVETGPNLIVPKLYRHAIENVKHMFGSDPMGFWGFVDGEVESAEEMRVAKSLGLGIK